MGERHLDEMQKEAQLNHMDRWKEDGWNVEPTT